MVHLAGSWRAMFRSTPEMGGPLMSRQRQGWPSALMALQQVSLGKIGLKGATAALQGMSCTSAEKKVLPHLCPWLCWDININTIKHKDNLLADNIIISGWSIFLSSEILLQSPLCGWCVFIVQGIREVRHIMQVCTSILN